MERMQHDLIQGTDAWHQFRLEHDGASEAAAMLGLSKKTTRTELLRMKHTGIAKEFSDWVQENVIDPGHSKEAGARPLVEGIIGEPLYPQTYSYGRMSASCDGLTASDEIAFEHKAWNAPYAAMVKAGEVPEEHVPQCQQVMHVTGAEKLIFVMSDGTPEKLVYVWVLPDPAWVKRIKAGWAQFHEDMKTYTPPEYIPAAVAAPIKDLPAVVLTVSGALSIETNFEIWGRELQAFIDRLPERVPEKLSTDQEFEDCKAAIAAFKKAEAMLDAEEGRVLSMVPDVEEMQRTKKLMRDLSSTTRLILEKRAARRDGEVKMEIVQEGKTALAAHLNGLNKRLATGQMPAIVADFAAAIKGKKLYGSMRDAVAALLAQKKIEANEIADLIQINIGSLDEAGDYAFLFHDRAAIVMKAPDDLALLIKSRIADHKTAEAKKLEVIKEAARVEAEANAAAKVKAEADAKAKAEQEAVDAQRKAGEEAAAKIERDRVATPTATAADRVGAMISGSPETAAPAAPGASSPRLDETPKAAAPTHSGMTGSARLLDRLDDLARQMTEAELSDLCIHAAHIIENRRAAA